MHSHIFGLDPISSKIMLIHSNRCETPVRSKVTLLIEVYDRFMSLAMRCRLCLTYI